MNEQVEHLIAWLQAHNEISCDDHAAVTKAIDVIARVEDEAYMRALKQRSPHNVYADATDATHGA